MKNNRKQKSTIYMVILLETIHFVSHIEKIMCINELLQLRCTQPKIQKWIQRIF